MGHGAIPQVNAVVVEQTVLTGNLQMVSSGQVQQEESFPSFVPFLLGQGRAQVGIAAQALAWVP
jgi:hypothetical protein